MILLTLKRTKPGPLTMMATETEKRAFSTRRSAELWLKDNGFFKGRRSWFNYKNDYWDWCREDERSWDFIDVEVEEYDLDLDADSRFKDFHHGPAPWGD